MASEDRKDATRYLPNFWHSLVQAIIQSRLGEKTCTVSRSPTKRSTMFNIEINTDEDVTHSIKKHMGNHVLTPDNPFSIEILLRTADGNTMVLEIWTLSLEENSESTLQNLSQITDRMSILLKSAICVSRITPAYHLSFRQGLSSYIILYRLYTGKPSISALGDKPTQVRVGQTNIQFYYLSLHLAYRTDLTFSSRKIAVHDQMMVKSDHFKADSSPKRHRKISERVTDSSDTGATSDESQEASRWPFTSPMDLQHSSPRSRTSSESSNRGLFSTSCEKIYVPFAPKPPSLDGFLLPEVTPCSNILTSTMEKLETLQFEKERDMKDRKVSESESEGKVVKEAKASDKTQMTSSDHSAKSFASNATKEDEYVVVDMAERLEESSTELSEEQEKIGQRKRETDGAKTPFADSSANDLELSRFFKEWQSAPPLKMFSSEEEEETTPMQSTMHISDEIDRHASCMAEFDELVKSLIVEDMSGSEELG